MGSSPAHELCVTHISHRAGSGVAAVVLGPFAREPKSLLRSLAEGAGFAWRNAVAFRTLRRPLQVNQRAAKATGTSVRQR